jgi:hypothetical protein
MFTVVPLSVPLDLSSSLTFTLALVLLDLVFTLDICQQTGLTVLSLCAAHEPAALSDPLDFVSCLHDSP